MLRRLLHIDLLNEQWHAEAAHCHVSKIQLNYQAPDKDKAANRLLHNHDDQNQDLWPTLPVHAQRRKYRFAKATMSKKTELIPVRLSHLLRHCSVGAIVRGPDYLMTEDIREWTDKSGKPTGEPIRYVWMAFALHWVLIRNCENLLSRKLFRYRPSRGGMCACATLPILDALPILWPAALQAVWRGPPAGEATLPEIDPKKCQNNHN